MIRYKHEARTEDFEEYLKEVLKINKCQKDKIDGVIRKYELEDLKQKKENLEKTINEAELLIYIYKRKHKRIQFSDCITSLLLNYSELDIRKHMYIYYRQNKELKQRKNYILEQKVPDEWNKIFKLFFYEKFFTMESVWKYIDGKPYSREMFHDNFKEDNDLLVCPYCDSADISDNGNLEVEHFWPESIYPFLAMNPLNLYSSCKSCNRPASGKGWKILDPISMPFYEQIGNSVCFKPNVDERKIHIKGKTPATNNFVKLINLEDRYSEKGGYRVVEIMASTIYATIKQLESKGETVSDKDITEYVSRKIIPKVQPHYFVTKDIMKDYNKYLELFGKV